MTLQTLLTVAPPANQREDVVDLEAAWAEAERKLGLQLPESYKRVANRYGAGTFGGWLHFSDILLDTDRHLRRVQRMFGNLKLPRPRSDVQPPFYPEAGGLFPWAYDDDAGQICWRTMGHPETWAITIVENDFSGEYPYGVMPVDEFLAGWLKGRIKSPSYYPKDIPDLTPPVFAPKKS